MRVEVRAGAFTHAYQGNWKFQVENTVDGYHPRFVHESAFKTREQAYTAREKFSTSQEGITALAMRREELDAELAK